MDDYLFSRGFPKFVLHAFAKVTRDAAEFERWRLARAPELGHETYGNVSVPVFCERSKHTRGEFTGGLPEYLSRAMRKPQAEELVLMLLACGALRRRDAWHCITAANLGTPAAALETVRPLAEKAARGTKRALVETGAPDISYGDVDGALAIYRDVFDGDTRHGNAALWRERCCTGHGRVYTTTDGFLAVTFSRVNRTLHLWLAGVRESARGQGIWRRLYEEARRDYDGLVRTVTLNTFPERFPTMFAWATGHGFVPIEGKRAAEPGKVHLELKV